MYPKALGSSSASSGAAGMGGWLFLKHAASKPAGSFDPVSSRTCLNQRMRWAPSRCQAHFGCPGDRPQTRDLAGVGPGPCEPRPRWCFGVAMGSGGGAKGHGHSPAELAAPLLSPQGGNACLQLHSPFHCCCSPRCSVGTWDNLPDPPGHHHTLGQRQVAGRCLTRPCECVHGPNFGFPPAEAAKGCMSYKKSSC